MSFARHFPELLHRHAIQRLTDRLTPFKAVRRSMKPLHVLLGTAPAEKPSATASSPHAKKTITRDSGDGEASDRARAGGSLQRMRLVLALCLGDDACGLVEDDEAGAAGALVDRFNVSARHVSSGLEELEISLHRQALD